MPAVVGIDFSGRALDIVKLDENVDEATWMSVPLVGAAAWERARSVCTSMPPSGYWDDVYICAIEKPFGPSRLAQSVLMRVQGAILAAVPRGVHVWEVTPDEWKRHLGIPRTAKPSWGDLPGSFFDDHWPQDARDALGIALYARDTNAQGIAQQLGGDAA